MNVISKNRSLGVAFRWRQFDFVLLFVFIVCLSPTVSGQHLEFYVATGHSDAVSSSAIAPNGRYLATGSKDGTVRIWDTARGKELWTFDTKVMLFGDRKANVPLDSIKQVVFSQDGRFLYAVDRESITVWDSQTGSQVSATGYGPRPIAVSPTGEAYAIISDSNEKIEVRRWDGSQTALLPKPNGYISDGSFSPDGAKLAAIVSKESDFLCEVWDVRSTRSFKLDKITKEVSSFAFSSDGAILIVGTFDGKIIFFDTKRGDILKELSAKYGGSVRSLQLSFDGKRLLHRDGMRIYVWDIDRETYVSIEIRGSLDTVKDFAYLVEGEREIIGNLKSDVFRWRTGSSEPVQSFLSNSSELESLSFSPQNSILAVGSKDGKVRLLGITGEFASRVLTGHTRQVNLLKFFKNGEMLASAGWDRTIRVWDPNSEKQIAKLENVSKLFTESILFSKDGTKLFTSSGRTFSQLEQVSISVWDIATESKVVDLTGHTEPVSALALSPDGNTLVSGGHDKRVILWDVDGTTEPRPLFELDNFVNSIVFSPNGQFIAVDNFLNHARTVTLFSMAEGVIISKHTLKNPDQVLFNGETRDAVIESNRLARAEVSKLVPAFFTENPDPYSSGRDQVLLGGDKIRAKINKNGKVDFFSLPDETHIGTLALIGLADWVFSRPDGRFDTNLSLDDIEGIHWIVNNEILNPVPLEAFMRQYYEPGLLQRVIRCNEAGGDACEKEFKPLPPISEINRVQSKVGVPRITAVNDDQTVNVTVEVESTTEKVTINADDHSQKKELASGVYDLRLFRDGQLIGTSTPRENTEEYIRGAPAAVENDRAAYAMDPALFNTNEDGLWRNANVIIPDTLDGGTYSGNICVIDNKTPTKAVCTFKNVQLPRDHRQNEVEFTAYAFNADRVKSDTVSFKYSLPKSITSAPPQKGRAYLISIGVNASENPLWNLQFAANDAREMQKVLGPRLLEEEKAGRYSKVVQVPLISARDAEQKNDDPNPKENSATKEIIKGVFSLLAGNGQEVSPEVLEQIPNNKQIEKVKPEDTVIITFAGHGYADQAGIFYLMPFDVGRDTTTINPGVLRNLISSDELSLWMQDITATEMIMIIDACHSAAAVQGDGFKPGPMGSRGLGQLAYDKGMKLLAATQSDNVAIELRSLQQGLLSFVLLNDAIKEKKAAPAGKESLTATEWLNYAVKAVPQLYDDVRAGRRSVILNARNTEDWKLKEFQSGDLFFETGEFERRLGSVQQPTVFDFRRRNKDEKLFSLPSEK